MSDMKTEAPDNGYFRSDEAELFTFYRIPKTLFDEPYYAVICGNAKILYGLMLDRMGLSKKNGWIDDVGNVFIYFTLIDAMEYMKCSDKTASKLFAELEKVYLIERRKQGQGKPSIIYLKRFLPKSNDMYESRPGKSTSQDTENIRGKTRKKYDPRHGKITSQDPEKVRGNNNEYSNTDKSKTDVNDLNLSFLNKSIYQSDGSDEDEYGTDGLTDEQEKKRETEICRERIRGNIEYDTLMFDHPAWRGALDELVGIMTDIITSKKDFVNIGGEPRPSDEVKRRFKGLKQSHIEYALECFGRNTTKIKNIRAYLATTLYNAPTTIESYYDARVRHDFYGSG